MAQRGAQRTQMKDNEEGAARGDANWAALDATVDLVLVVVVRLVQAPLFLARRLLDVLHLAFVALFKVLGYIMPVVNAVGNFLMDMVYLVYHAVWSLYFPGITGQPLGNRRTVAYY
mmetsp:Transcript_30013/g.73107  ORF Transcript_30013/g.73107 Transcript_30013/m.73107 type:complete len:116 (+) Transcript_30013:177-524(+)